MASLHACNLPIDLCYSGNLLKPALDIVLFTSQLSRTLGLRGSCMLALTYYATAAILKAVTPAFGRLAAVEARLEGEYRAGMSRIDREGEEIAYVSNCRSSWLKVEWSPGSTVEESGRKKFFGVLTYS